MSDGSPGHLFYSEQTVKCVHNLVYYKRRYFSQQFSVLNANHSFLSLSLGLNICRIVSILSSRSDMFYFTESHKLHPACVREADHSPQNGADVKKTWIMYVHSSIHLHLLVLNQLARETILFYFCLYHTRICFSYTLLLYNFKKGDHSSVVKVKTIIFYV